MSRQIITATVLLVITMAGAIENLYGQKQLPDVDGRGELKANSEGKYLLSSATLLINSIDEFVENLRAIAGGGRNIERTSDGALQVTFTEGTSGTYEVYWAGSVNNGMFWTISHELGNTGRYSTLDINQNGTYLAFHEDLATNRGWVYWNPDPFVSPDGFTAYGPLTPSDENHYVSQLCVSKQSNSVAYAWYDFTNFISRAGYSSDGTTFPPASIIYQGSELEAGPTLIVEGTYVLAILLTADIAVAPTDTAVLNHTTSTGGFWHGYLESTDAGATWSGIAPMFGLNIGDFPRVPAENQDFSIVGEAAAAGGTNWINLTKPVLYNNQVYAVTVNESVTLNDGVFPAGFWDGKSVPSVSIKGATAGGSWVHRTAGRTLVYSGGEHVSGNGWYGEISALEDGNNLAVTYVDRSLDVPTAVVVVTNDGGATWNASKTFDGQADLGFTQPDFNLFISTSSLMHEDLVGDIWIDLAFLGEHNGVINATLYHTMLPVSDLIVIDTVVALTLGDASLYPGEDGFFDLSCTNSYTLAEVEFDLLLDPDSLITVDSVVLLNRADQMEFSWNLDSLHLLINSSSSEFIGAGDGPIARLFFESNILAPPLATTTSSITNVNAIDTSGLVLPVVVGQGNISFLDNTARVRLDSAQTFPGQSDSLTLDLENPVIIADAQFLIDLGSDTDVSLDSITLIGRAADMNVTVDSEFVHIFPSGQQIIEAGSAPIGYIHYTLSDSASPANPLTATITGGVFEDINGVILPLEVSSGLITVIDNTVMAGMDSAAAYPGQPTAIDVGIDNTVAVELLAFDLVFSPDSVIVLDSVHLAGRAAAMQLQFNPDSGSILISSTGPAIIPPGEGDVLTLFVHAAANAPPGLLVTNTFANLSAVGSDSLVLPVVGTGSVVEILDNTLVVGFEPSGTNPGRSDFIGLYVENGVAVAELLIDLSLDPDSLVAVDSVVLKNRAAPMEITFEMDSLVLHIFSGSGSLVSPGTGVIAEIHYSVNPLAPLLDTATVGFDSVYAVDLGSLELPIQSLPGAIVTVELGDVNVDGVVNILDIQEVARIIVDLPVDSIPPLAVKRLIADLFKDGNTNILDLNLIIEKSLGNPPLDLETGQAIATEVLIHSLVSVGGIQFDTSPGGLTGVVLAPAAQHMSLVFGNHRILIFGTGESAQMVLPGNGLIATLESGVEQIVSDPIVGDTWGRPLPVELAGNKLVVGSTTSIQDESLPRKYELLQNFPNPFNPTTNIRFSLAEKGNINLAIYNILGQKIRTLIDGSREAGAYEVLWDGRNDAGLSVSSGVYLYRLKVNGFSKVLKLMVLR